MEPRDSPDAQWATLQVSNDDGEWVIDDSFFILVNAAHEGVEFVMPPSPMASPGARFSTRRTSPIRSLTRRLAKRSSWVAAR